MVEDDKYCTCCTPTNTRSKWFNRCLIFLAIVACAWHFGLKPIWERHTSQWNEAEDVPTHELSYDVLPPGLHVFAIWPFIVEVPPGHIGVKVKATLSWDIRIYEATTIPEGYIGTKARRDSGVVLRALPPGTYYINPERYDIKQIPKPGGVE